MLLIKGIQGIFLGCVCEQRNKREIRGTKVELSCWDSQEQHVGPQTLTDSSERLSVSSRPAGKKVGLPCMRCFEIAPGCDVFFTFMKLEWHRAAPNWLVYLAAVWQEWYSLLRASNRFDVGREASLHAFQCAALIAPLPFPLPFLLACKMQASNYC